MTYVQKNPEIIFSFIPLPLIALRMFDFYLLGKRLFLLNGSQMGFHCGKKEKWVIGSTILWLMPQK